MKARQRKHRIVSAFILSISIGLLATVSISAQTSDGSVKLFADGYELLAAGRAAAAKAKFELGLKSDPNNALANFYLGKAYVALDQPPPATPRNLANLPTRHRLFRVFRE